MLRKKNQKAQSTLEYVILVTAIIVVIIGLIAGKDSYFKQTMNGTLNGAIDKMDEMAGRWQNSI